MTRRINYRAICFRSLMVFVAVFLFTMLVNVRGQEDARVEAASLEKFSAGYIISDYQMGRYDAMTEAEIQKFLTSKNSCNNRDEALYKSLSAKNPSIKWHFKDGHFVCLSEELFGDGETIGKGETAAHIIWQAAQDYKINPQVLIVLLQKETGIITDSIPNDFDYRRATGYGCPDTAPCSEKYYGFKNQVRKAAALFSEVLNGGWTNYPLGKNYIQYNPSASCGGSIVDVKNLATSALYRYTPYQPNAGALAAGYGTATCGAYGNRNFYLYFEDWFGGIVDESPKKANVEPKGETNTGTGNKSNSNKNETVKDEYSGTYVFVSSLDNNKVLDISGGVGSAKDGTNVQLWQRNGSKAQEWKVTFNKDDGTYTIVNPYIKKALDVKSAGTGNGVNVQVWKMQETCAQRWKIEKESEYYLLTSACSDKMLDVKAAGTANGTNIQTWEKHETPAQKWKLEKVEILEDGNYMIVSALDNNKVLDISGGAEGAKNGTNIQLWQKNNSKAQEWKVTYNKEDDTYTLVNPYTKRALDVNRADIVNGTNIQLWETHETCAQRWKIEKEGKYYTLNSVCSDKVIDVSAAEKTNGTNIQLWQSNTSSAQKWKFVAL